MCVIVYHNYYHYRFTKCWEIKNNGRIAWPPGCTLQFNGGDFISVYTSLPTTTLEPGCTMTLSTDFVTPSKPGSYQSKWRMMLPTGTYFGGKKIYSLLVFR